MPATAPVAAYLDVDAIVAACQRTGADAVHPGFGFLSENAHFAEALAAAGITFIGPPATRDARDGRQDRVASGSRKSAGCQRSPAFTGEVGKRANHAVKTAREIGFPVMIKASAGGGGKGMRLALRRAECRDGFARATGEAQASFGDGRVFVERFIERPRHIEIQVLGDAHGNVIHLGERECSIQRRSPEGDRGGALGPFLDETTRRAMGAQAVGARPRGRLPVRGHRRVHRRPDRKFYFLEMNTRLQVEHPVTELVTGLDIVAEQIRIARGEALGYRPG